MKDPRATATRPLSELLLRSMRFEEVSEVLRLVRRAVEHGCRQHYDARQRSAVWAAYAGALFVETRGPFETIVAESQGRVVAVAQLDPSDGRLRALFVDGDRQQRGVGGALLTEVEARVRRGGATRLHGAMALNAVSFYLRAGFRPCGGPPRLLSASVVVPVQQMEKDLARSPELRLVVVPLPRG